MTLEETIDLMLNLYKTNPKDRKYKIGLYIETKMFAFYKEQFNEDIAEKLYKVLEKYGIETIDKCTDKLPIIVECFEGDALKRFA